MKLWCTSLVSILLLQLVSGRRHPELNSSSSLLEEKPHRISCEAAHQLCMYREGCGVALQNYFWRCSGYLDGQNRLDYCPLACHETLIALTSTEQGKHMMDCKCSDEKCERQLRRAQICRPLVEEAIRKDSVVSCSLATLICQADTLCSRALGFYESNCKSIVHGKKCSERCNNSLSILMRQEMASKLQNCACDGSENYDCHTVRANIAHLCLHQLPTTPLPPPNMDTNEVFSAAATPTTLCWTIAAVVALGHLLSLVTRES
ncbi:Hypothetical predicted protein [Cloeon dipterum]|uniref:GDNF/GAS1 domain-containing protein n=1 Tax=Cloeon dipterum TaxID=197152 RepID=A0A8S1BXF5_9INSE|nr:Hypothetical predicted protein [Cloeon dipterum]